MLDDCYGGCPGSPSLNRLSVTRADGHPFTLDRIDIANSKSALLAILEFVPEGTSGSNLQYVPLWHTDMTLSGDGSTVRAVLPSFDGVFPRYPGYPPATVPTRSI